MSGHDHCEEFIDDNTGPVYLVTGSGFECCYAGSNADKLPAGSAKFAYWDGDCPAGAVCPDKSPNSAFSVFTVTKDSMVIDIIDSAGKTLFTTPPIKPRSTAQRAQQ
jgi:tartrate-resistant acid phosphatase type 5